jgi:BlaI family penicillinase repressor
MRKTPKISDAEWEVMKVVWEAAPRTANDIVDALDGQDWSPATIRTLIGRLVQKKALSHTKSGREYLYSPRISREACERQERRSFIRRVYDGAVHPMVASLLEDEELSQEELDALHEILEAKRRKAK